MIIVKLMGGLGNQLFQYAAGKALAMKRNVPLKLDLSFLNADPKGQHTKRELELDAFQLEYTLCTREDLEIFENSSDLKKIINKFLPSFSKGIIVHEKGFEFDPAFFSYPANTYLSGFWQSENYFKSIRKTLLAELVLKDALPGAFKHAEDQIRQSNSVSLHIRRGDYVTHKNAQAFHGVLSMEYYHKALSYLNTRFKDLTIFVFSDDILWAKENLKTEQPTVYIDFNVDAKNVFDLHLMSLCRHNIIANSSFSWWGAWLNQHEEKIVIAPQTWFTDKSINTKDLIPQSWIRL